MANRTVSVELKVQVDQYKVGVEEAKLKTEELDKVVDRLDHDINKIPADATKAGVGLEVLGESAKKTGDDVDGLGKKTDTTADKTDKLGRKSNDIADALKLVGVEAQDAGDKLAGIDKKSSLDLIDQKIKSVRSELENLGTEFNKTGQVSLLDKIGTGQKDLASLGKLKGLVSGALKAGADDASIFESLQANISSAFEGGFTSPASIAVIGQAVAVALAAGGGLVAGIAGAGAAGLGVYGAILGNPDLFASEWHTATTTVKTELIAAGSAFTGPALDAIRTIGPTIAGWHLDQALAPAAKYVPELVRGLEGAATGLEHGFADLVAKGGPAVAELASDMDKLGTSAGKALSSIADGAEGGAQALHDVVTVVDLGIEGFGKLVEGAEKAYGFINDHPIEAGIATGGLSAGASLWTKIFGDNTTSKLTDITDATHGLSTGLSDVAAAAKDASSRLDSLNKIFDDGIHKALGLKDADVAVAQGLADVASGFHKTKDALDLNTQAGRDNQQLVLGLVGTLEQQREAAIAAGDGTLAATRKADDAYNQNLAKLDQILAKLLGSKTAAEKFLGAFKNTDFTITEHFKVVTTGPVSQQGVVTGGPPRRAQGEVGFAQGGIRHAAEGLIVGPSNPGSVLFGEPQTGGELFLPLRGIGKERAMGLAQVAGDAYGFGVAPRSIMAPHWSGGSAGPSSVAVTVTLQAAPGGDVGIGSFLNGMIRNGYFVVRASDVRPNV